MAWGPSKTSGVFVSNKPKVSKAGLEINMYGRSAHRILIPHYLCIHALLPFQGGRHSGW